jgi:hypothetical protein
MSGAIVIDFANVHKDLAITRQGQELMRISSGRFSDYSPKFRGMGSVTCIDVPDKISPEAACAFFTAVQNGKCNVEKGILLEMREMAEEWGIDQILTALNSYTAIEENAKDRLVETLLFDLDCGRDTSGPEKGIRENLVYAVKDERLTTAPLSVLNRIIDFQIIADGEDLHTVFVFVMKCLAGIGSHASVLLSSLDVSRLCPQDLEALTHDSNFIPQFARDGLKSFVGTLLEQRCEYFDFLRDVGNEVVEIRAATEREIYAMGESNGNTAAMVRELDDTVSVLGNRHEALKKRLRALEHVVDEFFRLLRILLDLFPVAACVVLGGVLKSVFRGHRLRHQ